MGLKPAVRSPRHEYCRRGAAKCCPSRCQEGAMPRTMAMDLTIDAIDSTHRKHEFPPPPGFSEQHYIGHEQDPRAVAKKVDQTQLKIKVCDVGTSPPTSLKSLTLLPSPLACLLAAHGPTHPDTRNAACHPTHAMPRVDAPCPLSHPPRGPAEGGSQRVSPTHRLSLSLSCSQKAKEQALQPARSFMMTGFMLWMSGNGVHIFSIMITFYAIYNPIKSAIGVNSAFARFADTKMDGEGRTSLILSKLVYVVLNLVAMLGALYKMSLMGLLPTTPSDWVSFLEVPPAAQFASGSEL